MADLDAAIEAVADATAANWIDLATGKYVPTEVERKRAAKAVRAAYPHIRRAVLNEAADDLAAFEEKFDPWDSPNAVYWLRERAEEGGDGHA